MRYRFRIPDSSLNVTVGSGREGGRGRVCAIYNPQAMRTKQEMMRKRELYVVPGQKFAWCFFCAVVLVSWLVEIKRYCFFGSISDESLAKTNIRQFWPNLPAKLSNLKLPFWPKKKENWLLVHHYNHDRIPVCDSGRCLTFLMAAC